MSTKEKYLRAREMRDELQEELEARGLTGIVLVAVPLESGGLAVTAARRSSESQAELLSKELVGLAVDLLLDQYPANITPNLITAFATARLVALQKKVNEQAAAQQLNEMMSSLGQGHGTVPSDLPFVIDDDKPEDETP